MFAWLLLLLLLAQLEEPRQHLQARDFFPADVSELSSVEAVELCCCGGTGFGVGVEVIVVGGCRQHVVAEVDFGFVAAGTTFTVVVVDSFVSLPGVVFRIFSSLATDPGCCKFCTAHRGHSPTLNGCSSLCLRRLTSGSNFKSLNLSLISHTALAVTMRLGLTGPDSVELVPAAAINCCCCWRSCCWCCCMVRFRTLALLDMVVEVVVAAVVSQIVTEDVIGGGGGGVAEVVTARNVPGVVAQAGML